MTRSGPLSVHARLRVACAASAFALSASAAAAPDIELGRHLSSECVTCHRAGGAGRGSAGSGSAKSAIPNIYGLAEKTFIEVVKAYRDKRLANAVMQNIAARLKDEEIEALAAYFARTRRP